MDVYQQLKEKRRLEKEQQERLKPQEQQELRKQQQQQQQSTESGHTSQENTSQASDTELLSEKTQPSLDTLKQIVNIVQATAPALPVSLPQEIQMPDPELANIIFGQPPSVPSAASAGSVSNSTKTATATATATAVNGHQHRKTASGAGSQQQPRTASPPTPASGSYSGAQKNPNVKGHKAIHAIELIRIAGEILQFPPATIGTSLVYYHKYRAYLHQANKRGERDNEATKADEYLFATACLHLACKCTEVSRKVRDLVNVTYRVMNPTQPALSLSTKADDMPFVANPSSGTNSQQQHTYPIAPPPTAATYWHIRDSLLTTELMLLRILQFDLDVTLPFSDVLRIYKGMGMVFSPTDEEAAQLYPNASNFDVFLPAAQLSQHPGSSSSSPNKHGTPSSSSSSSSGHAITSAAPHTGIHPTLSALVQISTTFCIDALCSSNIALNSSSRALAMGSIYLAIRSAGLELPMPFEEWCYAWGRPMIATSFGIQTGVGVSGSGSVGIGGSGLVGSGGASISNVGTGGVNGIMGLTGGTNNLFVSSPRPAGPVKTKEDNESFMEGVEMTGSINSNSTFAGTNGIPGKESIYSQTHSPLMSYSQNSPTVPASLESALQQDLQTNASGQQQPSHQQLQQQQQQPASVVDEVRRVVQELGHFYNR
ncbi:hypothetical protein BGX28_004704 [Mortierella sp. GBA30]|nr:hypothetical protein BGX28_004704 [Mortierella sp. GBA30]